MVLLKEDGSEQVVYDYPDYPCMFIGTCSLLMPICGAQSLACRY